MVETIPSSVTRPSISEAGMRIMRLLIGQPPQSMTDLITALKVTRTAVTEQISELIANNYVAQTQQRDGGRGRPRYLFSATELAMRQLFEGYQDIVVPAMWRAIRRHCRDEVVDLVCHDVALEIAERYLGQMQTRSYRGRMKEFADILSSNGRLIEFHEKKNVLEIRKFNCPFISMSDETGTLCCIDRLCMQMVVGNRDQAPVKLVSSRNEGHPCCTFQLEITPKNEAVFHNPGDGI